VTWVPKLNEIEHAAPQLMPAGELLTVPVPLPDLFTVRAKDWTTKPAVTVVAAFMVTTHVPVPVHPPPVQPVKVDPAAGVAVSVTGVPLKYAAEQIEPQFMPARLLETVPLPVPAFEIVSIGPIGTPVPVTNRDVESPSAVKLTFMKGASLDDPAGLFNSSLEGNARRAIDIKEGEALDPGAFQELIRAAVALNTSGKGNVKAGK